MVKGWLVQGSMVYITEFFASIDPDRPLQWHNKEDDRIVEEVAQGKGTRRKMSMLLMEKIMRFCYISFANMQKWIERYEEAKRARTFDQERFRAMNRERPFPPNLASLPVDMSCSWVQEALYQTEASESTRAGVRVSMRFSCKFFF